MNVERGEAATRLSSLIDRSLSGEDVVLTRNGEPLVRLEPVESAREKRPVGLHAQKLSDEEVEESLRPLCSYLLIDVPAFVHVSSSYEDGRTNGRIVRVDYVSHVCRPLELDR